ncbi:hypothetical protein ACFQS1_28155 [Paractinoplanes rhizophilus]|uniref:Uncharacterized protein n=1 Tax=Paractinoplanes rhizophilus TaxID=1416877 RepID=A0ABW2I0U4_9ACTN
MGDPRLVDPPRLGPANTVIGLSEQLPLLAAGVLFGPSFALLGPVYAVVGPSFALLGPVYAVVVPAALLLGALPVVRWLPAVGARFADGPARGSRRMPRRVVALIALSTARPPERSLPRSARRSSCWPAARRRARSPGSPRSPIAGCATPPEANEPASG